MKKIYFIAAMSAMLAACSQTEELNSVVNNTSEESSAINFDVYTSRATRAGTAGTITTNALKTGTHQNDGFGIFAYYSNNGNYDQYYKPDFMYNQQVKWNNTQNVWTYEPVKYWPNEYGNAAQSDDIDRLSFFAYAPWVKVVPSTGAIDVSDGTVYDTDAKIAQAQNYNITGMTKNTATGDPMIKYVVDWVPATSVDLLWAVDNTNGYPFIDQVKQNIDDKIRFSLHHALAKLNIQIDALVDGTSVGTAVGTEAGGTNAGKTKIYVRSITFEGFATKGALNLNNTELYNATPATPKPRWMDYAGNDELSTAAFTIYDGRKDGKEGYLDGVATSEKLIGLNPVIVQSSPYSAATPTAGVTNTAVNLFKPTTGVADPIYVIPTNEELKVTIVYDVETKDDNLAGYLADGVTHGSSIENQITKELKLSDGSDLQLEAGKAYTIKLHLGMTSVKVDATVTDWPVAGSTDVDLPSNIIAAIATTVGIGTGSVGDYSAGTTVSTPGGTTININAPTGSIATDLATFFTKLYNTGTGVTTLDYAGTNYTWDGTDNRFEDGSGNALVGAGAAIDTDNYATTAGSYILTFMVGDTTVTVNITTT